MGSFNAKWIAISHPLQFKTLVLF